MNIDLKAPIIRSLLDTEKFKLQSLALMETLGIQAKDDSIVPDKKFILDYEFQKTLALFDLPPCKRFS